MPLAVHEQLVRLLDDKLVVPRPERLLGTLQANGLFRRGSFRRKYGGSGHENSR